jgi:putative hydrolase of the HAD superfamily
MRFADVDALTLDCLGTLVDLDDPVPALRSALAVHGIERDPPVVRAAFGAEVAYYRAHLQEGRDARSLARLRERCAAAFLDAAGATLEPAAFTPDLVAALRFRVLPGVEDMLRSLRARALELVVVSNWDAGLRDRLDELGLLDVLTDVVTSAETGAQKPDPAIFRVALERVAVAPGRAVHVGDSPADARGAAAAGLRFEPAPLGEAVRRWS